MIRDSRLNVVVVTLTVLVASLVLPIVASQAAEAEPFKISGGGIAAEGLPFPGQPPRPHWAVGHATHLGDYYGAGTVMTDTAVPQPDGDITGEFGSGGPFVFIGANGDKLVCEYGRADLPPADGGAEAPGTFTLVPVVGEPGTFVAYFIAEFVSVRDQCTGKFEGCRAHWIMYAVTDPFVLGSTTPLGYTWSGEGRIKFEEGEEE